MFRYSGTKGQLNASKVESLINLAGRRRKEKDVENSERNTLKLFYVGLRPARERMKIRRVVGMEGRGGEAKQQYSESRWR